MLRPIALVALFVTSMACSSSKQAPAVPAAFETQGHRGCRGLMPENTIAAMYNAIDLGVTTLEMDLAISADRQVVVSHDPYFSENITTTPEGGYLSKSAAASRLLYSMPYDSIRKYDVGLKPHPDFPKQQKLAAIKPLLATLIDSAEAYAKTKGRVMLYNIEIKSKAANDGKKHPPVAEFVALAMNVINSKGITARTCIQSFDLRALQVMHQQYPGVTTSLLVESNETKTLPQLIAALGFTPTIFSPHFSLVNAALIETCRKEKMRLIPWTVNDLNEIRRLKALGVDGIISDYPDLFQQL